MWVAERRYAAAGAALVAASTIAVAPIAPQLGGNPVVSHAMRLIAGEESLLNVPLNLFYDFVNIPHYEIEAMDFAAKSLAYSGPWFVVSPTNLWGVDSGDITHFMSVVNFLMPNPYLSGMESNPLDFSAGFGQQLWGLAAAEIPINGACDLESCLPTVPTSPITGITGIDSNIWSWMILLGQVKFPLINNWFQVPLSDLTNGYTFGPDYPGYANPDGPEYPMFGFPGMQVDADGNPILDADGNPLQPFADLTYKLDLMAPLQNYWEHLMSAPATDGVGGTGIYLPDFEDLLRNLQSLAAASVIAFDPFTAGTGFCTGDCSEITDLHLDYPDIVRAIGSIWPGNTVIDEWLAAYDNGTANVPTDLQIQHLIDVLDQQRDFWDFGHASPPADYGFDNLAVAQMFHQLWTDLGFNPPPLAGADAPDVAATGAADALSMMFAPMLDSSAWSDMLAGVGPDFATMFGSDFATAFGTDLAELLGSDFASSLGFDIAAALVP